MGIYKLTPNTEIVLFNSNSCKIVRYNNVHIWPSKYTVTLTGSNCTTSGSGAYTKGDTCTVSCNMNNGYDFQGWADEYGNVISYDLDYTFTVTEDIKLQVLSTEQLFTINVSAINGTASGGGVFRYGEICTISCTPYENYQIDSWNDGARSTTRQITVTRSYNYVATCKKKQFLIYTQNDSSATITGQGYYDVGSTCTVKCTKYDTNSTFKGLCDASWNFLTDSDEYTFTVTKTISIKAILANAGNRVTITNVNTKLDPYDSIVINNPLGNVSVITPDVDYTDTADFTIVNNALKGTIEVSANRTPSENTYFWIQIGANQYMFYDTDVHSYPWSSTVWCAYYRK